MNNIYEILNYYKQFSQVQAIALAGSTYASTSDNTSDIDVYVFLTDLIPLEQRNKFIKSISSNYEVGCEYFGSGDEYFVDSINQQIDCALWNIKWFEDIIDNVWNKHYPFNGYTTSFLYTLDICKIVYDPENWLQSLKDKINTEYPKNLKQNIIKRNMMLMKDKPFASYYQQIEKAIKREDLNSINHRIAAFLASYFDVIFAINELLHPGEKRLVKYAIDNCKILPIDFEANIIKLLKQPNNNTLFILDEMVKNLKNCI